MRWEDPPGKGDVRPEWLEDAWARWRVPTYDWVYRTWAQPTGRMTLALIFLGAAAYIALDLFSDPAEFFDSPLKAFVGVAAAPPIVVGFSVTAVQAGLDLLRGSNEKPFFFSASDWLSYSAAGKATGVLWLVVVSVIVAANV